VLWAWAIERRSPRGYAAHHEMAQKIQGNIRNIEKDFPQSCNGVISYYDCIQFCTMLLTFLISAGRVISSKISSNCTTTVNSTVTSS